MNFDQQYTHARAEMEGGAWNLRAEIADQAARIAQLEEALEQIATTPEEGHPANLLKLLARQALESK